MSSTVTMRVANPADVGALHGLVESAYRGDSARQGWTHEADLLGGQRTDPDELHGLIADPDARVIVAERDGMLVGCVKVQRMTGRRAQLGMLSVSPLVQAAGLGSDLIKTAEAYVAVRFGADKMEMLVIEQRPALIAFYERRGYRLTGERRPFPYGNPRAGLPLRDDIGFVVLEKALAG